MMLTRLIASALLCVAISIHAANVGQTAPEFSLPNASGATQRLDTFKGQVVLVDFWASWCGPCRQSFGFLNRMHGEYSKKGLTIIGINVDENPKDAARFLDKIPAQFSVIYDALGVTPKAFDLKVMPSSYLIGRDGTIRFVHQGFRTKDQAAIEAAIQSALQEKS
jgi:cytochrome c biogenesis protein CcmG, thiol:disulfide interchange protein DsbE